MFNEVVLYNFDRKSWEIKTKSLPDLNLGESLIKVEYAGLCGSDMHRINAPTENETKFVMGHEIVGIVKRSDKKELIGKRVVVNPIGNCGKCSFCNNNLPQFCKNSINLGKNADGAFSKYIKAKNESLYFVPDGLCPELGTLVDGVAVVINGMKKLLNAPKSVLIVGDGTVGCLSLAVLQATYPDVKISLKGRHNTSFIEKTYNVQEMINGTYDLTIETVGRNQSDTLNQCVKLSSLGGQILVMGVYPQDYFLPFDSRTAFYKELTICGVNSFCVSECRNDFLEALNLINNHQELFNPLITHRFVLSDFISGIEKMRNKDKENVIKVVYEPNREV